MPISLPHSQALNELAKCLYDYLPGTPMGDTSVSFPGAAQAVGLSHYWQGGSKLPAVRVLLESTFDTRRDKFCNLIVCIVQKGIAYRTKKNTPLTRDNIQQLNALIRKLDFKIPELWDPQFLESLPRDQTVATPSAKVLPNTEELKQELMALGALQPQQRGFAFEKFLNGLFVAYELKPRGPFRLTGEQIDGSFELDHNIYLVEAKWESKQTAQPDLLILREKVAGKAGWSRGVFISYAGFTSDGLEAYSRGRSTNLIGITAQDLFFVLEGEMSLPDAIRRKIRIAAETGRFYVPIHEIAI